jgi:hypothetical protein
MNRGEEQMSDYLLRVHFMPIYFLPKVSKGDAALAPPVAEMAKAKEASEKEQCER